jgi:hypothetical protein
MPKVSKIINLNAELRIHQSNESIMKIDQYFSYILSPVSSPNNPTFSDHHNYLPCSLKRFFASLKAVFMTC